MELTRKSLLQLVILAYIAQISNCQHWSYGWLPGGKRSVGELEATLKMMDTDDLVSLSEGPSPLVLDSPYEFLSKDSSDFTRNRKRFLQKRRI